MVKLKMLKSIRLSRGLSLEQFSRLIGCSGQTIRNWERGRNKPSPLAEDKIDLFLEHLDNARNGKIRTMSLFHGPYGKLLKNKKDESSTIGTGLNGID